MSAGADDYWRKPVSFDELEARLLTANRVVRLHRRLAERTKRRDDSMRMQAASRPVALTTVTDQMRLGEEIAGLLARARRYGRTCTLAICDLDSLEAYNDQLGSAAADSALQRVAEGMRANLRSADALFRHGEELVVLLAEQAAAEAELAMERVRAQVEQLGIPSAAGGALTLSVGLAELESADDPSGERWIARARAALDDAKSAGPKSASSAAPRT